MVIGDPKGFTAEHSEAEPRLVFLKPVSLKAGETNVLITTKSGHEIPLHLISDGKSPGGQVDFFLDYERPRSFLVPATAPNFIAGETKTITPDYSQPAPAPNDIKANAQTELLKQIKIASPNWEGKQLQIAIGGVTESGQQMTVAFSVLNNADSAVELLPPQVQLSRTSKQKHGGKTKAEPVPIDDYSLTFRRLGPGQRADGVLVFERPAFKESDEQLLLQVAQVEQVDRPVLVSIHSSNLSNGPEPFLATQQGTTWDCGFFGFGTGLRPSLRLGLRPAPKPSWRGQFFMIVRGSVLHERGQPASSIPGGQGTRVTLCAACS